LLVFLAVVYFFLPDELPALLQRLLGLVCAALAAAVVLAATRESQSPDDLFQRLRRGQHLDFGKRLRSTRKKRRTVSLPLLGETSVRAISAASVFLVVGMWWLTPLAPIAVEEKALEDLAIPLGNEIMAAVLVLPDGKVATVQPPIVPRQVWQRAALIPEDAGPYQLALKALAENRFDDARRLLENAMNTGEVEPVRIHVVRGQIELFAGQFGEAVQWYENALQLKRADPIILNQTAMAWLHAGEFEKADPLARRALQICRVKESEEVETILAASFHIVAVLNVTHGRDYDQAEHFNKEAQDIWTKTLGGNHSHAAASLNNQAVLYQLRAKYPGIPQLNNRTREIWANNLGPQHPHVATSMCNLAMFQYVLGRYSEADEYSRQALTICRQTLPHGHPTVAVSLTCNAVAKLALGQCQEGQRLAKEALTSLEKKPYAENASVAAALNTVAMLLSARSLYTKAEPYYLRAVAVTQKALGPEHPYLATSLNNQADFYLLQNRLDLAEAACRKALPIAENVLGGKHPSVARLLDTCGRLEQAKNQPRNARPHLEKALAIREETLGKEHPLVADTLGNLAALDNSPRTYLKGIARYERAIEVDKRLLGETHPAVAQLLFGLGKLYVHLNKHTDAATCFKEALAIRERTLVPFHPALAETLEAYAALLRSADPPDQKKAVALEARAKAIRSEHAEEDRPEERQRTD